MKKHNPLSLLKFIELTVNARVAYNNAKKDPELKQSITLFGTRAIWYTLIFAFLTVGGLALFWFVGVQQFVSAVFLAIVSIILGIYMFIYGLPFFVLALNLIIKQLSLNKKFIGWLALVIFIIVSLVAIVGLILIFSQIPKA